MKGIGTRWALHGVWTWGEGEGGRGLPSGERGYFYPTLQWIWCKSKSARLNITRMIRLVVIMTIILGNPWDYLFCEGEYDVITTSNMPYSSLQELCQYSLRDLSRHGIQENNSEKYIRLVLRIVALIDN